MYCIGFFDLNEDARRANCMKIQIPQLVCPQLEFSNQSLHVNASVCLIHRLIHSLLLFIISKSYHKKKERIIREYGE